MIISLLCMDAGVHAQNFLPDLNLISCHQLILKDMPELKIATCDIFFVTNCGSKTVIRLTILGTALAFYCSGPDNSFNLNQHVSGLQPGQSSTLHVGKLLTSFSFPFLNSTSYWCSIFY